MNLSSKDRRSEGETTLRQCQLTQLYILHAIDAVCKKHGLCYLLEGGTLIGAMRHDGFIPWDDDLDIGMPRRDYERFLALAPKELPKGLRLQRPEDCSLCAIPFAKVRDENSFYCECRPDVKTSDPSGVYVDVFPYDDLPNLPAAVVRLLVKCCASSWKRARFFYNRGGINFFAVIGCACLGAGCQIVHAAFIAIVAFLNLILPGMSVIACLNEGYPFFYERAKMFPPKLHRFEDAAFPVPNDADGILTAQYGNWRAIPSPEARPRHARIIDPFRSAYG